MIQPLRSAPSLGSAAFLALVLATVCAFAGAVEDYAGKIAPLIDPAKLATLRERGANPRVQKYVYWLAKGREDKADPAKVATEAVRLARYTNAAAAKLTEEILLRNLKIAEELGTLDAEGMAEMRKGNSATVKRGPYAGQELSVDHIIPRAVCPELDNVIANLELLPLRLNSSKGAKIGQRQLDLAGKLNKAGLLSASGLNLIQLKR